jgi:hypothetical protein
VPAGAVVLEEGLHQAEVVGVEIGHVLRVQPLL